jgi:predicted anti-sigma-YlaC factor YlaD
MKCTIYQELISAWLDDEISSFEKLELQKHLDQCPSCRAIWKSVSYLQEQILRLTDPDVPDELWNRITEEIRKDKQTEKVILLPTAYGRKLLEAKGESYAKVFDSSTRNINKKTG